MELTMSSPIAALSPTEAKAESAVSAWILVTDRLPEDGELVNVMLDHSREIRTACRGHYESTGAWFDAKTHGPIYEKIMHWQARDSTRSGFLESMDGLPLTTVPACPLGNLHVAAALSDLPSLPPAGPSAGL